MLEANRKQQTASGRRTPSIIIRHGHVFLRLHPIINERKKVLHNWPRNFINKVLAYGHFYSTRFTAIVSNYVAIATVIALGRDIIIVTVSSSFRVTSKLTAEERKKGALARIACSSDVVKVTVAMVTDF